MIALALMVLAVAPDPGSCAFVKAPYLDRVDRPKQLVSSLSVHPDGLAISFRRFISGEFRVARWTDELDQTASPAGMLLPGNIQESYDDGRVLLKVVVAPPTEFRFEIWTWRSDATFSKTADASTLAAASAVLCNLSPAILEQVEALDDAVCASGHLVATRGARNELISWQNATWQPTGTTVTFGMGVRRVQSYFPLDVRDFDRAHEVFARIGVPTVRTPDNIHNLVCGSHACWAVERSGALLLHDLQPEDAAWNTVGQLENPDSIVELSGDGRALLLVGSCSPPAVYFLKRPPSKNAPPPKQKPRDPRDPP
jgi:hypothetical protein